jgi:hypothetical protein
VTSWLCIIGDRDALWWVLHERRMAFPVARRRRAIDELDAGDLLYLYTTRGAFHNPNRDRGRVIGRASADERVHNLAAPFELDEREFPIGCTITLHMLAPRRTGVELVPLREKLKALPSVAGAYQMALRQPLLRLTPADARLLDRKLENIIEHPLDAAVESYRR